MFNQNYDNSINPYSFGNASAENIKELDKDEIYVFGSNLKGIHDSDTALLAKTNFRAKQDEGEGITGQCYALPTKSDQTHVLFLKDLKKHIDRFISYAGRCPTTQFLVTKIGCGLAGYGVKDIAPLFNNCIYFKNIHLPKEFILHLLMKYEI